MRTITRLFSLLAAIILPFALLANVVVKGTVKYTNGQFVNNYEVHIDVDSSIAANTTCLQSHLKRTNANGFYQDTLICNSNITRVIVWVRNCDGSIISHALQVGTNNVVESNFEICSNASCKANFGVVPSTSSPMSVYCIDSSKSGSTSDSIIGRRWTFGDGTADSTHVNAFHAYSQPGVYVVCLRIKTASGCVSEVCRTIVIGNNECRPEFTFEPVGGAVNLIKFNSAPSTVSAGDSIISRKWSFGDGTSMDGNVIAPQHQYAASGVYTVCLTTKTKYGCEKTVCKPIVFGQVSCHADWNHEVLPPTSATGTSVRFHSQQSTTTSGDSIISRKWKFGDGTGMDGNVVDPLHVYLQPGTYNVCLLITSARGCKDSVCKPVVILPNSFRCKPGFTHIATGLSVKFNSAPSQVAAGDSIISRFWTFGDGSSQGGNLAEVTHQYQRAGEYEVCLRIQTRTGCMETYCTRFAIVSTTGNCVPYFIAEQITSAVRTMRFNSTPSFTQLPGDSIIERKWTFGDGSSLGGNIISPTHQYAARGSYSVCLQLKTALGCDTRICKDVLVQGTDSSNNAEAVKIINLYPVPVTTQLNAVIWSRFNNVNSEISIYDVYGVKKWSQNKLLPAGNSTNVIPVSQLANGPYIFRVTTIYGVVSRNFYKVQ